MRREAILKAARRFTVHPDFEVLKDLQRWGYDWSKVFSGNVKPGSFEHELHVEMERKSGITSHDPREIYVPLFTRDLSVTGGNSTGGYLVETEVSPTFNIPALRAHSVVMNQPNTIVFDAVQGPNLRLPRVAYAPSAGSGETQVTSVVTGSNPNGLTFEQASFTGTWYSTELTISNQTLKQASDPQVQGFLTGEMHKSVAMLLDYLAINGTGSPGTANGQTLGILNYPIDTGDPGQLAPSVATGGQITLTSILAAHFNLDSLNYRNDRSVRKWFIDPSTAKRWASTPVYSTASTYPVYILDYNTRTVGGYEAVITN
jgi:HK97 family phage major capsid protein